MSWHTRPMLAFDTETTGPEPAEARIVTACSVIVNAGPVNPSVWLVNPGMDIPAEATEVHGVTTEHARENGQDPTAALPEMLHALQAAWSADIPVVGYNVAYDLTVLDCDLRRNGHSGIGKIGPIIDPLVLDRGLDRYRRGKRTLTVACEVYRVQLDGAHDASNDAIAAARVAWRIAQRYPQVAEMSLADLQDLQATMHKAWAENFQDYLRRQGKDEVIDPSWPLRSAPGMAVSASSSRTVGA